jgi:uncharacterized membrane protein YphA (DoxX/SURF4 family)
MRQITVNLSTKETITKSTFDIILSVFKWLKPPQACERSSINRSVDLLRWALAFIYLWFGALKFFPQLSSAEGIAGATLEIMTFGYLTPTISLPLLALWETAIGLALLTGKFQRPAVYSLYFHVAGTLVPLVLFPEQMWSTPPFAASLEGQYIFKNLVTVGAALVISANEGCRK